jgi:hypothetical protein
MGNWITEIGNNAITITALYLTWRCWVWYFHGELSLFAEKIVVTMGVMSFAVAVCVGWWGVAIYLATPPDHWHVWFVENKWAMTLPVSIAYTYAATRFTQYIDGFNSVKEHMMFIGVFFLAAGVSLL